MWGLQITVYSSRDVRVTQVKLRMWNSSCFFSFPLTLFVDGDFLDIVDFVNACIFFNFRGIRVDSLMLHLYALRWIFLRRIKGSDGERCVFWITTSLKSLIKALRIRFVCFRPIPL